MKEQIQGSAQFVVSITHRSGNHSIKICQEYDSHEAAIQALEKARAVYPNAELLSRAA